MKNLCFAILGMILVGCNHDEPAGKSRSLPAGEPTVNQTTAPAAPVEPIIPSSTTVAEKKSEAAKTGETDKKASVPDERSRAQRGRDEEGTTSRFTRFAGEWKVPNATLKIEPDGKGTYTWLFVSGALYSEVVGDLTLKEKEGRVLLTMSPLIGGSRVNFEFVAKVDAKETKLELEETQDQIDKKTFAKGASTK
jgi:hypothetical protein